MSGEARFPTAFEELVEYLLRCPRVLCEHFLPEQSCALTFTSADAYGHLHFVTDAGEQHCTLAGGPCGPGGFKPELSFNAGGFAVRMFGETVQYRYVD